MLAGLGCLVDLATKNWIFGRLGPPPGPIWWIAPNWLGLQTSLNEGALFGVAQGLWAVFAALSIVALVAIPLWLFYGRVARSWLMTIALGCVTAGILGNLYDRLGLHGLVRLDGSPVHAVRDWVLAVIFGWPWPNFNVADSLLVAGAILLVGQSFAAGPDKQAQPDGAVEH